jgi:serine/threonine protein phosphatase PrpC
MDSFFSIIDGDIRIFAVLDGHGERGHTVSSAAMSILLDYIRNRNDVFKAKSLSQSSKEEILVEIKKAFKFTQQVLREDFQISRHNKKAQKLRQK